MNMKTIQKLIVPGTMTVFVSLIILSLWTTRSEAQVMQVSCDAAPNCSYPQRTNSDCGPQVCASVNTDPIPTVSTSISCDPPSGCSYPQRTQTSCGLLVCLHVNTDPVPVVGPITNPDPKVQDIISSIKKQLSILRALLSAMLQLRWLGVHVN